MAEYKSKKDAEKALKTARQHLVKTADALRKASKAVKAASTLEDKEKARAVESGLQQKKKQAIADCAAIQLVLDHYFN